MQLLMDYEYVRLVHLGLGPHLHVPTAAADVLRQID